MSNAYEWLSITRQQLKTGEWVRVRSHRMRHRASFCNNNKPEYVAYVNMVTGRKTTRDVTRHPVWTNVWAVWLGCLADSRSKLERGLVESHATAAFWRQVGHEAIAAWPVDERTHVGAYVGSTLGERLGCRVDDADVRNRHVHRRHDSLQRADRRHTERRYLTTLERALK